MARGRQYVLSRHVERIERRLVVFVYRAMFSEYDWRRYDSFFRLQHRSSGPRILGRGPSRGTEQRRWMSITCSQDETSFGQLHVPNGFSGSLHNTRSLVWEKPQAMPLVEMHADRYGVRFELGCLLLGTILS